MSSHALPASTPPGSSPLAVHHLPWTWPLIWNSLLTALMISAIMLVAARQPLILLTLLFPGAMALLFAGMGLAIIINRPRRIVFFNEGMRLEWLVGAELIPWERVASVRITFGWHLRLDISNLWNPRTVRVRVRLSDGRRLTVYGERGESDLQPRAGVPRLAIDDAASLIGEASLPARLVTAAARLAAGQSISFDGVQVSAQGLTSRGQLLAWEAIADLIGTAEMVTVLAVGQAQPWRTLLLDEGADADLLLPLIAHLRGKQYRIFQADGAGARTAPLHQRVRLGRLAGLLAVPLLFVALHFGVRAVIAAYSPEQLQERGEQAFDRGEYELAWRDFDRVVQLRPRQADAYVDRGRALAELGRYDDALVDYQAALRLCPTCYRPVAQRARVLFYKGQVERAIDDYTRVIAVQQDYAFAWCGRGEAHAQLGHRDAALADYEACLAYAVDPGRKAEAERLLGTLRQP